MMCGYELGMEWNGGDISALSRFTRPWFQGAMGVLNADHRTSQTTNVTGY